MKNLAVISILFVSVVLCGGQLFGLWTSLVVRQGATQVITHISGVEFEGEYFPVSSVFSGPNPNGATPIQVIDDGLRRIFINKDSIAGIGDSNRRETEFDIPQKTFVGNTKGFGNLQFVGPINGNGHRRIRVNDGRVVHDVVQGITKITPRWCQLETLANPAAKKLRTYPMRISTSTVPREVLKKLLRGNVERGNIESHLEVVEFFIQSEDFQDALKELDLILRLYPKQVDRIRENRRVIKQVHARQYLQQIESRIEVGQTKIASQMIDVFEPDGVATEILVELAEFKDQIKNDETRVQQALKAAQEIIALAQNDAAVEAVQKQKLQAFQSILEKEIRVTNVDRLATFLRLRSDDQKSLLQKASLAISGWYLGSNAAIDNFAVSDGLTKVHALIQEYLSSKDKGRRNAILEELREYEAGQPSFIARIVSQMKPPLAPAADAITYDKPMEFIYEIPGSRADGGPLKFRYQVHVPPEYDPYRKYPCIVALPSDKDLDLSLIHISEPTRPY